MIERFILGATIAALIAGLYLTAPHTIEAQAEIDRYCEMIEAWKTSDGEHGWPDYNGNFDEVCTEDQRREK